MEISCETAASQILTRLKSPHKKTVVFVEYGRNVAVGSTIFHGRMVCRVVCEPCDAPGALALLGWLIECFQIKLIGWSRIRFQRGTHLRQHQAIFLIRIGSDAIAWNVLIEIAQKRIVRRE